MATPDFAISLKILSDAFLKLIQMIARRSYSASSCTESRRRRSQKSRRVGLKALIYFEIMTTIALTVGLLLLFCSRPATA